MLNKNLALLKFYGTLPDDGTAETGIYILLLNFLKKFVHHIHNKKKIAKFGKNKLYKKLHF